MTTGSAQADALELCARVRDIVADSWGYDAVLAGGSVPEATWGNRSAEEAPEFTGVFASRRRDAAALASDLRQIAFLLVDAGLVVQAEPTSLRVSTSGRPDASATFYALLVDGAGTLRAPTTDILSPAVIEEVYWAQFYTRNTYASGSTFQSLVQSRADLPQVIVDIGCGDGRDTCAFAAAGRHKVTGIDRSHVAIRAARLRADLCSHSDALSFLVCDVGDPVRVRAALRSARDGSASMVFYLRFFLHSVTQEVQNVLMSAITDCSRPGDCLAAEFRTDKDADNHKVHGNHYRRFQNGPAFGRMIRNVHGFVPLLEQEGTGFSPYGNEDPHLYRLIARRT